MRPLLATLLILVPVLAHAQADRQPIPDAVLQQDYERCVASCEQNSANPQCANLCACAGEQMSQNWSLEEYRAQMAKLEADPQNEAVNAEVGKIIRECANRS